PGCPCRYRRRRRRRGARHASAPRRAAGACHCADPACPPRPACRVGRPAHETLHRTLITMTDVLTPPPGADLGAGQEARQVAEDSREKEWESPSFVREMFEGNYRMDLVYPFPAVDPAEVERARPFM